jgi:hypothetical protein
MECEQQLRQRECMLACTRHGFIPPNLSTPCVCVWKFCVCARKRDRYVESERERERVRERESHSVCV